MMAQTSSNLYERSLKLAEAGQHQEALNCMREHLRTRPDDAQALNDAGAILHCLGRSRDAISYLTKARVLRPDSAEIVWNLVETYLGDGRPSEAASLLDDMERMDTLNVDILNRTAAALLDQNRKGQAIDVLLRSQRMWSEQQVIAPMLEVIRGKRPKVALFRSGRGEDGTLAEAWASVEQRFQTEFCEARTLDEAAPVLQWCDIAWFDGGGEIVAEASRTARNGKTIVSLRRSDVRDDWAREVRWENVDILMQLGSAAVEDVLLEHVPDIRNRTRLVVIPHGINLGRYAFQQRARGKHLACMGCLSLETNPAFLLQCMQKLHYLDHEYKLSVAGPFESPALERYVRHMVQTLGLTGAVSFTPFPGDLNVWLADKHFIVSAGMGEGQVEALLAGMARGLKPIVHNFPSAETLLPRECLFNISEQFCEQVISQEYDSTKYRRFVEQRYPMAEPLKQVNSILAQLETEIDLRQLCENSRGPAAVFSAPPAPGHERHTPADFVNVR
ncbi:MAG: tetratricopeptide repeat protein [Sedimentisphaerales bacterium]|nr:tetratricopeptide repeat protein [Sedimentisphaerales bacterium]